MADPAPDNTTKQKPVKNRTIEKVLTGLFDSTDIYDYKNVPGVEFVTQKGGNEFQSYEAFHNTSLTKDNISRVKITITVDGKKEDHYFKKIVQNEATGDKIADVTSKKIDEKNASALKATAWIETDKDGIALSNKDGETPVYLTFPGFKGNLLAITPQTKAARAGEAGELYPPTAQIAAFLKTVEAELKTENISAPAYYVAAHSFGSPNGIVAGALLDRVKDIFLEEPVIASGTLTKLKNLARQPDPKKAWEALEKELNISENDAKKVFKELQDDTFDEKITCRRSVDKEGCLSHAAMLEVFDPKDTKRTPSPDAVHARNIGLFGTGTVISGRGDNKPDSVDPQNQMVGMKEYELMGPEVIKENKLTSVAGVVDPKHAESNTAYAEQIGAPIIARSYEKLSSQELKEKVDALNKPQEPAKPPPNLDAAMVNALKQFGVDPKMIAGAEQTMEKFVKNGLSGINGMVESLGLESTLKAATQEISKIASDVARASKDSPTR